MKHVLRTGFSTYCGLNVHGIPVVSITINMVDCECQKCIETPEFQIELAKVLKEHASGGESS